MHDLSDDFIKILNNKSFWSIYKLVKSPGDGDCLIHSLETTLKYLNHDIKIFRRRSKKTSKLRGTGLCVGNSPMTGERASNVENVSIWRRHHDCKQCCREGARRNPARYPKGQDRTLMRAMQTLIAADIASNCWVTEFSSSHIKSLSSHILASHIQSFCRACSGLNTSNGFNPLHPRQHFHKTDLWTTKGPSKRQKQCIIIRNNHWLFSEQG